MPESIIQVADLSKHFRVSVARPGILGALAGLFHRRYRTIRAVDQVTFTIAQGELVGYLGPNGAGKSTTIKMLTGLLVPTSGNLKVDGRLPWKDRQQYVSDIGAVFGQRTTLWWDLPVIESLELLKHIYRIPAQRFKTNLDEFRQLLELDAFLEIPVRSLSLGQRMRADLCAALLHQPKLLFLDEPTIGLDVVAKERIRQFIRHVNREHGVTVLLTTHDLSDVERLCRRVMIIDHGKLLYDGTLEELRRRFGGKRELQVEFSQSYSQLEIEGAEVVRTEGNRATFQFERHKISASSLIGRLSQRYRIRDLTVREPDIESTIRRIYEEKLLD
ncbi:MAG: ATP-binding cassette domain-containing protein [Anaerolineales bacterium]|jgi:ABC-2 type transport system ATP-binding protein